MILFALACLGVASYVLELATGRYVMFFELEWPQIDKLVLTLGPPALACLLMPFLVPLCESRERAHTDNLVGKDLCFATLAAGLVPAFMVMFFEGGSESSDYLSLGSLTYFAISFAVLALFAVVRIEIEFRKSQMVVPIFNWANGVGFFSLAFAFDVVLAL